ncbi:MAG: hypothetical protein EAZ08_04790 [Cytophagales bacterium]|nr:MAG: hypothetical protein EAZ08_04790 [Cytophagales bacterium]
MSKNIVKNGFTKGKNECVLCKDCGKSHLLHKNMTYNKKGCPTFRTASLFFLKCIAVEEIKLLKAVFLCICLPINIPIFNILIIK